MIKRFEELEEKKRKALTLAGVMPIKPGGFLFSSARGDLCFVPDVGEPQLWELDDISSLYRRKGGTGQDISGDIRPLLSPVVVEKVIEFLTSRGC